MFDKLMKYLFIALAVAGINYAFPSMTFLRFVCLSLVSIVYLFGAPSSSRWFNYHK